VGSILPVVDNRYVLVYSNERAVLGSKLVLVGDKRLVLAADSTLALALDNKIGVADTVFLVSLPNMKQADNKVCSVDNVYAVDKAVVMESHREQCNNLHLASELKLVPAAKEAHV
jgi:hypothetical protein